MESSSPRNASSLSSIIGAEKIIAPARARALLASLAQLKAVPQGPTAVREWADAILVERDAAGVERAMFAPSSGMVPPAGHEAVVTRHIDALRAAAVAMLWGRESAQGPDGQPRYPRLRKLLVDQWDDTRGSCDGPDKLMMFFDATLALDRAAEPRVGVEGFKTLSLESVQATTKDKQVGTIGVPFDAIVDTATFRKAARPGPAGQAPTRKQHQGPWPTPQVPTITQSPDRGPRDATPRPASRSMAPIIAAVMVVVVLAALGFLLSR